VRSSGQSIERPQHPPAEWKAGYRNLLHARGVPYAVDLPVEDEELTTNGSVCLNIKRRERGEHRRWRRIECRGKQPGLDELVLDKRQPDVRMETAIRPLTARDRIPGEVERATTKVLVRLLLEEATGALCRDQDVEAVKTKILDVGDTLALPAHPLPLRARDLIFVEELRVGVGRVLVRRDERGRVVVIGPCNVRDGKLLNETADRGSDVTVRLTKRAQNSPMR
jgi:hypothetical protein